MADDAIAAEVDRNYDAFLRGLSTYLPAHAGQYALMHGANVVAFHVKPGDAYRDGMARYPDRVFSIQEVTDEPIDLGFFSHVGS